MFSKLFLFLFAIFPVVVFIRSEDCIECLPYLEWIQDGMFLKMASYTKAVWNKTTPGRQNIHLYPVIIKIRKCTIQMEIYHDPHWRTHVHRNKFLVKCYELGKIVDKLQNSPNIELKYKMAMFYDERYVSMNFLKDIITYFHAEPFDLTFDPSNEPAVANMVNSWLLVNTKGRKKKNDSFDMKNKKGFVSTLMSYTGCWQTPKYSLQTIETSLRRRRTIPTMPNFVGLHFDYIKEITDVKAFTARETVGYYNNLEKKYEAIRIPFKNDHFAMIVLLPYYNYSLDIMEKFTDADYRYLLRHVNDNQENIHYTIPIINSTMFLINEKGASINGDHLCDWSVIADTYDTGGIFYKPFLVNRPFSIFIYDDLTLFVLMYALVRNPSSSVWPTPKFRINMNTEGEEHDIEYTNG